MMKVNGEVYYHIHTVNKYTRKWKIGRTIRFSNDSVNRIFPARFAKLDEDIEAEKKDKYFDDNLKALKRVEKFLTREASFIDVLNYIQESRKLMLDLLVRSRGMLKIINSYNHLLNEIIFEQIRKSEFAELPSRLKCTWLCDKRNIKKWVSLFEVRGKRKTFEVQAYGEVYKVDRSWLPIDLTPPLDLFDIAREYWKGSLNPNPKKRQVEYLFTGKLKVIRELVNDSDETISCGSDI
jgi:hypothetical protein